MENTIKIFGGSPKTGLPGATDIVPGDLVKYDSASGGWIKLTTEDYSVDMTWDFSQVGMAVESSAHTAAINMGHTEEGTITSLKWGLIAIVKFGDDWEGQGQFTRAAETLAVGDLLLIENGVLTKFDETLLAAGSVATGTIIKYNVVGEVLIGSTSTTGAIRFTTVGYPQLKVSAVGTL